MCMGGFKGNQSPKNQVSRPDLLNFRPDSTVFMPKKTPEFLLSLSIFSKFNSKIRNFYGKLSLYFWANLS